MLWTSVLGPSHCVPNCVCVSGTGGLWQHIFGHTRMTWQPKDIQVPMLPSPAQVCVGCWKQCADIVCMCGLVLQSQLYMFKVHVVVGNLVGDSLGLLLCPCLSQQLPP